MYHSHDFSDERIKAIILRKLRNRGCWGERYTSVESLGHWLTKKIKRNGKRVQEVLRQLIKEQYLLLHKKGETISLNPGRSKEISEFIRKHDIQSF